MRIINKDFIVEQINGFVYITIYQKNRRAYFNKKTGDVPIDMVPQHKGVYAGQVLNGIPHGFGVVFDEKIRMYYIGTKRGDLFEGQQVDSDGVVHFTGVLNDYVPLEGRILKLQFNNTSYSGEIQ